METLTEKQKEVSKAIHELVMVSSLKTIMLEKRATVTPLNAIESGFIAAVHNFNAALLKPSEALSDGMCQLMDASGELCLVIMKKPFNVISDIDALFVVNFCGMLFATEAAHKEMEELEKVV